MKRKAQALGLALVAAMALGAIGAQGAMGEGTFYGKTVTYLTGTQDNGEGIVNHIVLDGKESPGVAETITCGKAVFEGRLTGEAWSQMPLTPSYSECEIGEGAEVAVTPKECDFEFGATLEETTSEEQHASVDIVCGEEPLAIEWVSGGCTITIGTQKNLTHGVVYDNEGSGDSGDLRATVTVHGIDWSTDNSFLCTLGGLGADSGEDATYLSEITLKRYQDSKHTEQLPLWWE